MHSQNLGRGPVMGLGMFEPKSKPYEWGHSRNSTAALKKAGDTAQPTLAGVGNSPRAKAERRLMQQEAADARQTQVRGLAQQRVQAKAEQGRPRTPGGPKRPPPATDQDDEDQMQAEGAQSQPAPNSGAANAPLGNARRGFGSAGQGREGPRPGPRGPEGPASKKPLPRRKAAELSGTRGPFR